MVNVAKRDARWRGGGDVNWNLCKGRRSSWWDGEKARSRTKMRVQIVNNKNGQVIAEDVKVRDI